MADAVSECLVVGTATAASKRGGKHSFPSGAVEQTAAVFAALTSSRIPLDERSIATQFRKTRNTDKKIGDVLSALARLGHVTTNDGKMFAVGRVA